MKLFELVKSNHWLSIELILLNLYPDQEKMLNEYRNVFEKLKTTTPVENDMDIVLSHYKTDSTLESEKGI